MKPNYIGIIGGILAFVSLALPWWTMTVSIMGISMSADLYLYKSGTDTTVEIGLEWYCWAALALVLLGGILGIVGSVTEYGKKLLIGGGALALLSIIIFAVGLQMDLSGTPVGLFSSVTYMGASYSTYLSFGFWIALVAAIMMFIAPKKAPVETVPAPPPPPPPT